MAADPRARLDAIFRAATLKRPLREGGGRAAWRALPEEFGRADTVSRTHRRWAARGLWSRLLRAVAAPGAPRVLRRLTHWVCCAFRRAIKAQGGLAAIALARRLRLFSALPAPPGYVADPDLSEIYSPVIWAVADRMRTQPDRRPPRGTLRLLRSMSLLVQGRSRLRRDWEPA